MMENQDPLKELFAAYQPPLDDSSHFMAQLNKRLEAVEYVRKVQEAQLRRYKMAILIAFVLGIIAGGTLFFLLLASPSFAIMHFALRTALLALLAALTTYGIIAVLNLLQDIANYSSMRKKPSFI